jgi:pimeloyl-ACP methyl ester carboxylesterase
MDGTFVDKFILPAKGRRYSGTRSHGLVWLRNDRGDYFPNHFLKRNSKTVILYAHGNAGTLGDFKQVVSLYSKWFGTSVFAVEYPGYGPAEGEASEESVNDNFETAYDFITKVLKYPSENVIFIGYSIGTGPTIHLASKLCRHHIPLGAVISIAGFMSTSDIVRGWKGSVFVSLLAEFLNNRWDNMADVAKLNCPIFFLHGAKDDIIPVEHSQRMFAVCSSTKKKLKVCPEADHTTFDDENDTKIPISQFLKEAMRPNVDVKIRSVPQQYFVCPQSVIMKERSSVIAYQKIWLQL